MGSDSDGAVMAGCTRVLEEYGIRYEARVLSAHRTPDATARYVRAAEGRGLRVIVAGAGGAAHLAGVVDVEDLHVLCVQHPEDLLDVGGHLLKSFFTLAQGRFRLLPPRDVPENGDVTAGEIVRFRRIFNEDRLAIRSQNPRLAVFVLAVEEATPDVLENSRICEELPK